MVADGGLAAITASLAVGKPDVLLINWESLLYPGGRTEPNPAASLLPAWCLPTAARWRSSRG